MIAASATIYQYTRYVGAVVRGKRNFARELDAVMCQESYEGLIAWN